MAELSIWGGKDEECSPFPQALWSGMLHDFYMLCSVLFCSVLVFVRRAAYLESIFHVLLWLGLASHSRSVPGLLSSSCPALIYYDIKECE